MTMTPQDVAQFKYPAAWNNGDIIFEQDGNGDVFIGHWSVPGVPKPTIAELLLLETDPVVIYNYAVYRQLNSPSGYGTWQDQFDMIYNDLENGTQTWTNMRGTVKYVTYPTNGTSTNAPDVSRIMVEKRSTSPSAKEEVIASASSEQAISGTSKVTITLDSEQLDPNNKFSSNTYTVLSGGIYEVSAYLEVDNIALVDLANTYPWELYVTQSGSSSSSYKLDRYDHGILAAIPSKLQGTRLLQLDANDTLVLQVQKGNSTSLSIRAAVLNIKKVSDD